MKLAPFFKQRFLDSNGAPLAGGLLYSYIAQSTTPLTTYADADGATNQNPVELDANGEADIWLDPTVSYKFALHDADDVPIWTKDKISLLILEDDIGDGAVTEDKIADDAVTTVKILDAAVTTDKIDDDAVTSGKILDGAVTTNKILDANVTKAKLAALGQQISSSCGAYTTTTTGTVTNLSVSLTTTGRPVFIGLVSDGANINPSNLIATGTTGATGYFYIKQGSTVISFQELSTVDGTYLAMPCSILSHIYVPAAGTYTYTVVATKILGTDVGISYAKLVAFEL